MSFGDHCKTLHHTIYLNPGNFGSVAYMGSSSSAPRDDLDAGYSKTVPVLLGPVRQRRSKASAQSVPPPYVT